MRKNIYDEPCACQDTTILALDRTAVSRMVAASSMLCFFIFVTGYFWGKRHAIQSFATSVEQEAMADRMHMSFATTGQMINAESANAASLSPSYAKDTVNSDNLDDVTGLVPASAEIAQDTSGEQEMEQRVASIGKTYYAQLVGFGAERNARRFVRRLAHNGITEVQMTSRISRMPSGKKRTWYQVVTKPLADHEQVVQLVDRIKTIEKLHDVRIVAQQA